MELKGDIKRIDNLSLSYKTYIGRSANSTDLEICMWNEDNESKYTIASFNYSEDDVCYTLDSCVDRLNNSNINWLNFGKLVLEGYKILEEETNENSR